MLQSLNKLRGYLLQTSDGHHGRVKDFYFDEKVWIVRYLVAATNAWLPGKHVLISPSVFERRLSERTNVFQLNITRTEMEESPAADTDKPVSQRKIEDLYSYYRWSPYWVNPDMGNPSILFPQGEFAVSLEEGDPHLHSINDITGYRVHAKDGEIGHVDDFIADRGTWAIRYIAINTRNWLPGRKVLIASQWIDTLSWEDQKATIPFLSREQIKDSPPYDSAYIVDREYEQRLHGHYRQPAYWKS